MKSYLLVVALLPMTAVLRGGEYSTYIGDANDYHVARAVADSTGNTYLAGSRALASQTSEIFVIKLDRAGNVVMFNTLSGRGSDSANDLALDASGNIYLAGATTSQNFPLYHPLETRPGRGFVTKLSADGSQVIYSTYFPEAVTAVAVDFQGNVYVTGSTFSPDFPVTSGLPAGPVRGPGSTGAVSGAFVTKISAAGDRILYSAVISGGRKNCGAGSSCFLSDRFTRGVAIAVDATGAAFIAGNSDTSDLPAGAGALLVSGVGAFVAKVNREGTALAYLTYIGPTYDPLSPNTNPANTATAITVDAAGNAYVAGSTFDPLFPATPGGYQTALDGTATPTEISGYVIPPPTDAFLAKLNPGGTGVVWATYLGKKGAEVVKAVALDPSGRVWVAGTTNSPDFPNSPGWSQGGDFVAALDATGSSLVYAARFPDDTVSHSVATDPSGMVHVAGPTGLVSTIAPAEPPTARIFGIANFAAGPATGRIAGRELIAIYGPHIGPETPTTTGVQVSIGGDANVPVLYASDSQIIAVVPRLGVSRSAVHIIRNGVAGPDFPVEIVAAAPEVFRQPDGYAAAINQDGTVNSAEHPAGVGSIVSIWATGSVAPSFEAPNDPLDFACCEVTVGSGFGMGSAAKVLYGGVAPGLVAGVVQVNFRVPVTGFPSSAPYLELTLHSGGRSSLPVRIYAQ